MWGHGRRSPLRKGASRKAPRNVSRWTAPRLAKRAEPRQNRGHRPIDHQAMSPFKGCPAWRRAPTFDGARRGSSGGEGASLRADRASDDTPVRGIKPHGRSMQAQLSVRQPRGRSLQAQLSSKQPRGRSLQARLSGKQPRGRSSQAQLSGRKLHGRSLQARSHRGRPSERSSWLRFHDGWRALERGKVSPRRHHSNV
jgi:hypothetical protein